MAKIKICGITRKEDMEIVNRYLPEYAGFIFAESRRRLSPSQMVLISANLDKRIRKAGVFVNEKIDELLSVSGFCGLDIIQVNGDESPEYIENLKKKLDGTASSKGLERRAEIWKAIRVKDISDIKSMSDYNVDAFVLDAFVEGSYGGAGRTFDWDLALKAGEYGKIILAGGLNPNNVLQARNYVQPYALDVSSGVETDGFKDDKKIGDFILKVRSY